MSLHRGAIDDKGSGVDDAQDFNEEEIARKLMAREVERERTKIRENMVRNYYE